MDLASEPEWLCRQDLAKIHQGQLLFLGSIRWSDVEFQSRVTIDLEVLHADGDLPGLGLVEDRFVGGGTVPRPVLNHRGGVQGYPHAVVAQRSHAPAPCRQLKLGRCDPQLVSLSAGSGGRAQETG